MRRASDEQGFALIAALVVMVVILGLGIALLTFTDNQQSASLREQASESSFNVAEGSLNAQIGQLSHNWPAKASEAFTGACTAATSTETNGCPTTASLAVGYPNISPVACKNGTPKDPWGSELTNQWTTYIRDNAAVNSTTFNSATEQGLPAYDANGDGKLWVRAVGVAQCRLVTVISLISRQLTSLSFPTDVASGSWFEVTNNGKHKGEPIVNTAGEPPGQPGEIGMRCEAGHTPCEKWDPSKEQIKPFLKGPALPTPLLSEAQLAALREEALVNGTLHTPTVKGCPGSLSDLEGLPAYVEGCGALHMTGGTGNSEAAPGFLVLADGSLEIKGNGEFFGVIYAHNPSNSSGAVVSLGGTATVHGAIDVDGPGGIEFGSNGVNLVYSAQALKEVKTYAGATSTRNTFRVLPSTQ